MKGYKAFHKGLTAYGGFQYEIDKEYTITGELKMCANGFHFCRNLIDVFGYYDFDEETVEVAVVKASGKIINEGTKYCAEKIKIIRMVSWTDIYGSIKDENRNTGNYNSGYCNTGNYNSGYYNSGSYNSGDYNSGFFNTDKPTVRLFNKDSGMTFEEFFRLGIHMHDLEESKPIIQALPNYDAQVFFEATGIDWGAEVKND